VWKSEDVGEGYSSVTVVGDKVFTMGDKDRAAHLFGLDRKTGKVLWETKVGNGGGNRGRGTRSTPTYDNGLVYGLGQSGDLICVEAKTGKEKWSKSLTGDFGGGEPGWNYCESVLVDGDRVVFTPGGKKATVVALNKKDGEEIWRAPLGDSAQYSSIVISNAGGIKQYVQLTGGGVVGLSAKDGKLLWRYKKWVGNTANVPTPIVLKDQIFASAGYGTGGALLTVSKGNDGLSVKEEYFNRELTNKHGGVVIVGDYAYGDRDESGTPWCAEWKTGKVKWRKKGRGSGSGSASLTYADGHLYIRYQNGWVALVPADGDDYTEKGGFKIPNVRNPSWSHPVVIGGRLYLREQGTVYCYDVSAK
jgi:outer membrane protein assembly factor BamB